MLNGNVFLITAIRKKFLIKVIIKFHLELVRLILDGFSWCIDHLQDKVKVSLGLRLFLTQEPD